jgi:hypothetical protein
MVWEHVAEFRQFPGAVMAEITDGLGHIAAAHKLDYFVEDAQLSRTEPLCLWFGE